MMSAVAAAVVYLNFVVFRSAIPGPLRFGGGRPQLAGQFLRHLRLMVVPWACKLPTKGYIEKLSDPRCLAGAAGLLLMAPGSWD
jgi:hypothetical protein